MTDRGPRVILMQRDLPDGSTIYQFGPVGAPPDPKQMDYWERLFTEPESGLDA